MPAYTLKQEPLAMETLKSAAVEHGTSIEVVKGLEELSSENLVLNMEGEYQKDNAALAIVLASVWLNKKTKNKDRIIVDDQVKVALAKCAWPGRAQMVKDTMEQYYYVDGAHTPKSMLCCVEWYLGKRRDGGKKILVLYISHDRDVMHVMEPLLNIEFDVVLFCPVNDAKPSKMKFPSVEELLQQSGKERHRNVSTTYQKSENLQWQGTLKSVWHALSKVEQQTLQVLPSVQDTIEFIRKQEPTQADILVTGSLYLVGNVLDALDIDIC